MLKLYNYMVSKREVISIILGIIIFTLLIAYNNNRVEISILLKSAIISIVIILVSVLAKKITARNIDTKLEIKILEFKKYWITRRSEFKKAIPSGVFLPLLLAFLSSGFVKFLTFFQFELEALPSKSTKRYGVRRFSTVMDWDYALVIFYNVLALLALSIICDYFSTSIILPFKEISKYSIYYLLYNMIPLGKIDGLKLYIGSRPLYLFSLILILITGLVVLF